MLKPVTTTLKDIQQKLVEILHPRTILLGHSLDSDLKALKLTHPFIVDTSIIYPHPRGPPLKSSLKWLAQKYLGREVQKGDGASGPGHDSIEDSKTCLDLVKQKCEKGPLWGTTDSQGENLFKRLARTGVRYKNSGGSAIDGSSGGRSSAAIDWGDPKKGAGAAADFVIGCSNDEEVVDGVIRAVNGDPDGKEIPGGGVDFVWARMRELESLKGWWNNFKNQSAEEIKAASDRDVTVKDPSAIDAAIEMEGVVADTKTDTTAEPNGSPPVDKVLSAMAQAYRLIQEDKPNPTPEIPEPAKPANSAQQPNPIDEATALLTSRIRRIYESLPPCTAFIIYSGSGDPREMARLQAVNQQFRKEYRVKKWDELSVKWTDIEDRALKAAANQARRGIGFVAIK